MTKVHIREDKNEGVSQIEREKTTLYKSQSLYSSISGQRKEPDHLRKNKYLYIWGLLGQSENRISRIGLSAYIVSCRVDSLKNLM